MWLLKVWTARTSAFGRRSKRTTAKRIFRTSSCALLHNFLEGVGRFQIKKQERVPCFFSMEIHLVSGGTGCNWKLPPPPPPPASGGRKKVFSVFYSRTRMTNTAQTASVAPFVNLEGCPCKINHKNQPQKARCPLLPMATGGLWGLLNIDPPQREVSLCSASEPRGCPHFEKSNCVLPFQIVPHGGIFREFFKFVGGEFGRGWGFGVRLRGITTRGEEEEPIFPGAVPLVYSSLGGIQFSHQTTTNSLVSSETQADILKYFSIFSQKQRDTLIVPCPFPQNRTIVWP